MDIFFLGPKVMDEIGNKLLGWVDICGENILKKAVP